MASITLTVDPAIATRVLDGFAKRNGYTGTDALGQPETKINFMKRTLMNRIKGDVVAQERADAAAAADAAAEAAGSGVVIT